MAAEKQSDAKANKVPPTGTAPLTLAYRRKAVQQQLARLKDVLAMDLPQTERAIVLRRYECVCKEAAVLGVDLA